MSGKRKINKDHPDYPEYIEKCRILSEPFVAREEAIDAMYIDWIRRGLKHPGTKEIYALKKQFHRELKELQKEYDYLFIEDIIE